MLETFEWLFWRKLPLWSFNWTRIELQFMLLWTKSTEYILRRHSGVSIPNNLHLKKYDRQSIFQFNFENINLVKLTFTIFISIIRWLCAQNTHLPDFNNVSIVDEENIYNKRFTLEMLYIVNTPTQIRLNYKTYNCSQSYRHLITCMFNSCNNKKIFCSCSLRMANKV